MASANLINSLAQGGNTASQAFTATTNELAAQRQRRFQQNQLEKQASSQDAIDAAIRESSMGPAAQPTPNGQPPVIQSQDLSTPNAPVVSTPIPAAVAPSAGLTSAPASYAGQNMQAQPQSMKLTPFDTPEFTANLQRRLASIPGSGNMIMQMRKERDTQVLKVIEMSAKGNVDEARFLAKQSGLEIPEVLYQNGDVARAMTLSAKAYPDEPQKAQAFTQAFMTAQGGLQEKVNAGISAGGTPTTASQRQLNNQIALLKWKAANPQYAVTDPYKRYQNVGGVGLVDLAADGGPKVAIGPTFNYQAALQQNIKSIAGASMGTKTADQIYNDAKDLTDRMAQASNNSSGARLQDTVVTHTSTIPGHILSNSGVSPGLMPPQAGRATPNYRLFDGAPQIQPQPANKQLQGSAASAIVPQSQEEIDSAPSGTVFLIDGQLMQVP